MVEANPSLTPSQRQAQRQAERMRIAVRVEAQRRAREEVKARLRREGRVKLCDVPARDITAMAEALVIADAVFRAKLIAEGIRLTSDTWANLAGGRLRNLICAHVEKTAGA